MLLTLSHIFSIIETQTKEVMNVIEIVCSFPIIAIQIKDVMNVIDSVRSFSYHCNTKQRRDECN